MRFYNRDFDRVNPTIFSDIQNIWDQYVPQAKINLIVCGSIYSLMKHIFENRKEPLFGRLTSKILLKPFKTSTLIEILLEHNPGSKPTQRILSIPVETKRILSQ